MAYINQFSTRPGTFAILKMEDDVSKEKKSRDKRLTEILKNKLVKKMKNISEKFWTCW